MSPHPPCIDAAKGLLELAPPMGRPVMIAGPGRSGTTVMMRVLMALGLRGIVEEGSVTMEHTVLLDAWGCRPPHRADGMEVSRLMQCGMMSGGRRVGKVPGAALSAASVPDLADAAAVDWVLVMRDPVPQCHYDHVGSATRDVGSVLVSRANRNLQNARAAAMLAEDGHGVLVVSYEVLLDRDYNLELVSELARRLRIDASAESLTAAVGEIIKGDPRYHGRG